MMINVILWIYIGFMIFSTIATILRVGKRPEQVTPVVAAIVVVLNVIFVWALASKLVAG